MTPFMPKYRVQIVPTATPAAIGSGPIRIIAVEIAGGSAASKVEFKNAATDTGDVLLTVNCLTNDDKFRDYSDLGGIAFGVACYAKPAGTGALVYVWYEPMQTQVAFA